MKRLAALLAGAAPWPAAAAPPPTSSWSSARVPTAKANLTLLVSDGGTVTCNGT